jgi:hypothetical protein
MGCATFSKKRIGICLVKVVLAILISVRSKPRRIARQSSYVMSSTGTTLFEGFKSVDRHSGTTCRHREPLCDDNDNTHPTRFIFGYNMQEKDALVE